MPSDREVWYRGEVHAGEVVVVQVERDGSVGSFETWNYRRTERAALERLAERLDSEIGDLTNKIDEMKGQAQTARRKAAVLPDGEVADVD